MMAKAMNIRTFFGILAWLVATAATPAVAQVINWWGGSATGTGYPNNSTPVTASATGTTGTLAATLPGVAGKTTFICGFVMTSGGSGSTSINPATVAGTIGGTLNFVYVDVPGNTGQGRLVVNFEPVCIPAGAMNTAIVVNMPAGGTGTTAAVSAWGYQL